MQAIAGITARMAEIQAQITSFTQASTHRPAAWDPTATLGAAGSLNTAGVRFAEVLGTATAERAGLGHPSHLVASGALTASGAPVELARYGNGRIPESALAPVAGTRHRLWAPAAVALDQLRAAARADGVQIGITDAYRTYDSQVDLARRKGLYSQGGLAAQPGTSEHGWGMAVDLALDTRAQAWMRTHAGAFGFTENTPREPWHWAYAPRT